MRTWMTLDISFFVRFLAEKGILMPAGMYEQNIAILHIRALLNIFRCEEPNIIEHVAQIDDHSRSIAPFNWNLINCFAFGNEMPRGIEVCAHMIGRLDVLRVDTVLRLALDVLHL